MAVQHWPERASTVLLTGLKCYNTGLSPSLLNRVMLQFLIALPDNLIKSIHTHIWRLPSVNFGPWPYSLSCHLSIWTEMEDPHSESKTWDAIAAVS